MFLSGDAMQWHKLTLDFEGPLMSEVPSTFTDYRLDVTFTHESGLEYTVPGYFAADGDAADTGATSGSVWRAHFNPPLTGEWRWSAAFRTGDGIAVSDAAGASAGHFDGENGSLSIVASDKTGDDLRAKGMLEYDGDQYMSFAGTGETFLKSGVGSPENLLAYSGFDGTPDSHDYAPHVADFKAGDPTWANGQGEGLIGAVNYLADHGVNSAYMMLMNIGGDGRDVSPWADPTLYDISKNPGYVDLDTRAQVFDLSKLDQWEIVFSHMQEQGITLHLFLQETENDQLLNNGELGFERMLFMREMVARFGHHNGLIWNLGEENTNTVSQLTDHSAYLQSLDTYDHAVALHTYPGQHSTYESFEGSETLDVLSFQTSGDQQVPDLDRYLGGAENAGRPVVAFLDEPGTAGTGLAAEGDSGWQTNHENMRETLWEFYSEGGSGVEWYFGYQTAGGSGGDLKMEDFSLRESAYQWTASAREFFEQLPLGGMSDGDAAVSGPEAHGLMKSGELYAYFLPDGGSPTIDLTGIQGAFRIGWYDPIAGGAFLEGSKSTVDGGSAVSIGTAPPALSAESAVLIWNTALHDFPVVTSGAGEPIEAPTDPLPDNGEAGIPGSEIPLVTLRLVDTETNQTIGTLLDGQSLDPSFLGDKTISIVADVSAPVGSVRLSLGAWSQVENVAPYALFGDTSGDYKDPATAPFADPGDYTLKVELFQNTNASGKIGETLTAFTVGTGEPVDNTGDTPPPDPTIGATWVARDGLVVMQAENGVPTDPTDPGLDNWSYTDNLAGHTGDGYLHWTGGNLYKTPGSGALSYEFEVTEGGDYYFSLLGSRPVNGLASDLNNDFFVRMNGGEWNKVFFSGPRETWTWGATFDVNHVKSPAMYELEPGVHTLEISGRSDDAYLDRLHLSLGSVNKDIAAEETLAPLYEDNTPPETNTLPEARDDALGIVEAGSEILVETLLANDSDQDSDTLRITGVEALTPDYFSVLEVTESGAVRIVVRPDVEAPGAFRYTIDDGRGGTDTAVASLVSQLPETEGLEPADPTNPSAPTEPSVNKSLVMAINIGARADYVAGDGTVFAADTTGVGRAYSSEGEILGTVDDALYTSEAWSKTGLSYDFALEDGAYDLRLHFAEIWGGAMKDGGRVFDVAVEGQIVADDLDVYAAAGGRSAYVLETTVQVTDGILDLDLLTGVQNPKLSALEIWKTPTAHAEDAPGDTPSPTTLNLVDARLDQPLFALIGNTVLHQSVFTDRDLTVSAEADEALLSAESAKLSIDGVHERTESVEPYALFGDRDGDHEGGLLLAEGEPTEIGLAYYSEDGGLGDLLLEESVTLTRAGNVMIGRSGEPDTFAVDPAHLDWAEVIDFENHDELVLLGHDSQAALAAAETVGDHMYLDFGDGRFLKLIPPAADEAEPVFPEDDLVMAF